MKVSIERLRPAFVVTGCVVGGCVVMVGCTPAPHGNPPPLATTAPAAPPVASEAPKPAPAKRAGVHPRDDHDRLVFRKADGTCYVEAPGSGPPPPDLMSGEKWVEHKAIACPKEFDEPAFAAIGDGMYWLKDEATGKCSQAQVFGNPPPPPKEVPCPPSLQPKK